MFIAGGLVPVKRLVNGTSIVRTRRAAVIYHHVELPAHAIILAVESYLDTGDRQAFGGDVTGLFADFGRPAAAGDSVAMGDAGGGAVGAGWSAA